MLSRTGPLLSAVAFLATTVAAQEAVAARWEQCGGFSAAGYTGPTKCAVGLVCVEQNLWYSHCLTPEDAKSVISTSSQSSTAPSASSEACTPSPDVTITVTLTRSSAGAQPTATSQISQAPAASASASGKAGAYAQCGGQGFTGPTTCIAGFVCVNNGNQYYSQCLPTNASNGSGSGNDNGGSPTATASSSQAPSSVSAPQSTTTSTKVAPTTSTRSVAPSAVTTSASSAPSPSNPASGGNSAATGFLGGLNLAGFDFGMSVWGWSGTFVAPPISQIAHFASQGVNVFRIPFGWQYMESSPGAGLNGAFFSQYDAVIQAALKASTAPYVILDLHNYGRWNSGVVGADGPTSAQFASLWGSLAKKYASNPKIMFGLMNEPHDMSIDSFKASLQAAVNAIRAAGATSQYILLPGTDWTHASSYLGINKNALISITDPAGGTDKLVMDFHQYLDQDGSGTNRECVTDRVSDVWEPVAKDLRATKRKAIITEIGGASTASCQKFLKQALASIKANSDVYLGFTAWSAGAFDQGYELSLTPANGQDTPIWIEAVKPNLPGVSKNTRRSHRDEHHISKQRLH